MPLIYNKDGWLFENPQENIVHDITIDEINQLLNYTLVSGTRNRRKRIYQSSL